ncbi:MAG: calcium-binding protein, partial [Pseudomonadota bacterium]
YSAGGNDSLYGLDGNDFLQGGDGNDRLYGDAGNDSMTGGDGDDAYYVDSVGDVVIETSAVPATGGIDTVYSYLGSYTLVSNIERGVIRVDTGASLKGNTLNNSLYGNVGNDTLYGLNGNDALLGGDGNDRLYGDADNDSLMGGNGDDTLIGGTGFDTMTGGNGNDAYYVDDAGDVVTETSAAPATGGMDAVYIYLSSYTLTQNVERGVIQTSAASSLTGNILDNALYGGVGNDSLDGGIGKDTMTGGGGSDLYHVDNAGDEVIEINPHANGGMDTVYSYISKYTLTNNVESGVIATSAAARLSGNALSNSLYGGVGNDTLMGDAGADSLYGAAGGDQLTGGLGADSFVFHADSGRDVIRDFSRAEGDRVSLQSNVNGSGITSAASALAHVNDIGGNAVLNLGDDNIVILVGVHTADLTEADFMVF